MHYEAAATAKGAGDAWLLGALLLSASAPLLLLPVLVTAWAFSLFSLLLLLSADGAAESSLPVSGAFFGGAVHREISHVMPVKLLS